MFNPHDELHIDQLLTNNEVKITLVEKVIADKIAEEGTIDCSTWGIDWHHGFMTFSTVSCPKWNTTKARRIAAMYVFLCQKAVPDSMAIELAIKYFKEGN